VATTVASLLHRDNLLYGRGRTGDGVRRLLITLLLLSLIVNYSESVVNGAQVFYYSRFGISDENSNTDVLIQGLVNSAPYLCCAV
jgi:hypothetical protein